MEISISGKIQQPEECHAPEVSKQTGFPSAATHYTEQPIDLHKELTINKDATFYVRVGGNGWTSLNIKRKDVLIVDRSLSPGVNDLALVVQDGEFAIRRITFDRSQEAFTLWGIITYIIHYVR